MCKECPHLNPCFIFQSEEAYVCIYSHRSADTILFTPEGGVDIGDVDAKALKLEIPVGEEKDISEDKVKKELLAGLSEEKQA